MRQILRSTTIGLALVWAAGVLTVTAQTQKPAPTGKPATAAAPTKNPVAQTAASVAAGEKVYGRFCKSCHGASGAGDGGAAPDGYTPANFTDAHWDHGSTDVAIFKTIKGGVPPDFVMEGWDGRIRDVDIWNVINYLRTLGPKDAKR
jgi:mono/diheme cytochrome c family protein